MNIKDIVNTRWKHKPTSSWKWCCPQYCDVISVDVFSNKVYVSWPKTLTAFSKTSNHPIAFHLKNMEQVDINDSSWRI